MADIFISYSSKDRQQAEQLTKLLASAGLSVWIDRQGIVGAEKWATEIVEGIRACTTFILLISPHSVESENVLRELSLASEKRKRVLPVDLEPTELPTSFEYPLAGLQRVPFTEFDRIVHAHKHGVEKIIQKDKRKSLMILPFEDLSPTGDNEWFANGIVSELIGALSHVKSLRVMDAQTTRDFKRYQGTLPVYAREMDIRYFVQGDVRKFGDQIKISTRLLDIETGDHLWQDSLKGTMDDIFDIQEKVAEKVVDGLKIHLDKDEKKKLAERGTENAEAYELYLKGRECYRRHTKSDYERALALYEESVRLDPNYANAHAERALASQGMYRQYSRTPSLLEQSEQSAERIRQLEGETAQYACLKSGISLNRGDLESAISYANRCIEIDPNFAAGYDALGFAYHSLGNIEGAVSARKEQVRLRENDRDAHSNLLTVLNELPDTPENRKDLLEAAERALPVFERYIRLNPDDYNARVQFASVLRWASRTEEALQEADKLSLEESLGGVACYNLACLYLKASDTVKGFAMVRRSISKGFQNIEDFRRDPDLAPLRGTPEFEELVKELEEKIAMEKNG
jgi:TolB-like protein/Tfp pilus assembly protein PilF